MNTYDTGDAKYMNLMVLKKMLILNTLQDGTHVIHFRSEKLHHPHKQKQTRQKYELVQWTECEKNGEKNAKEVNNAE